MTLLRVLICHNRYQLRGGEDSVFEAEVELLREYGHEVRLFERSNAEIDQNGKIASAVNLFWSFEAGRDFGGVVAEFKPDIVHAHNTFARISPSIYWVANRMNVPVVQTLHNFRLLCPQALFLRDGKVCEDCLGNIPWRGAVRGCYRDSKLQSTLLAGMLSFHRAIGTWQDKVTRYIALNEFCRDKFIAGGLPPERIAVKPNFVNFPVPDARERSGFLFVGRLSKEKGVDVLVNAARLLEVATVRVAGTGPAHHLFSGVAGIAPLGALSGEGVRREMTAASVLILPSIWYECFPRTLVEAFGCGLPVIASRLGALGDLVEDGVTGLLFEPGNSSDLAAKMRWALDHPEELQKMGRSAREHYEKNFTAAKNYEQLMAVYTDAIAAARQASVR